RRNENVSVVGVVGGLTMGLALAGAAARPPRRIEIESGIVNMNRGTGIGRAARIDWVQESGNDVTVIGTTTGVIGISAADAGKEGAEVDGIWWTPLFDRMESDGRHCSILVAR
ncbi:hypothetical protein Vretifemale_18762, partial [Volvox reticuliferus]